MFLWMHVVGAVILVFFGYIALWSSYQQHTPDIVAKFGRIMAIILYTIAALMIIFSVGFHCCGMGMGWHEHMEHMEKTCPSCMKGGMMGKMEKGMGGMSMQKGGKSEMCGAENEIEVPVPKQEASKK